MIRFKLYNNELSVVKISEDGTMVSCVKDTDEYKQWLVEGNTPEPEFTAEDLQALARTEFKAERDKLVSELEITYNGVVYQADEVSQGRMSRAILALPDDTTTTLWIASDNTPMQVTKVDLSNILRMAGEAQTAIWVG